MTRRKGYGTVQTFAADGCKFHDHCLTCPLPECHYVSPQKHSHYHDRAEFAQWVNKNVVTIEPATMYRFFGYTQRGGLHRLLLTHVPAIQ